MTSAIATVWRRNLTRRSGRVRLSPIGSAEANRGSRADMNPAGRRHPRGRSLFGTMAGSMLIAAASAAAAATPGETPVHSPASALGGLEVADGLQATLFAAEPMLLSPSNIDVDHRGRVWVCEIVNYRKRAGTRPEGDRILILEDTDEDGRADKQTVFYQGPEVDTAMGICVLGNRVIVSVSPNIFVMTDDDGDDRADRTELLFTNTGQPQHDHSAHAFVFGPDGRLYWNFGNTGKAVHDRAGDPVVDLAGNPVVDNGRPYHGGMVFRCNPDGSDFEVLAHNFRNNYEVAVDSFGTLWQSDNDDDGHRGVRINFLMEYGNYGYRDETTGAGWQTVRTGMHAEVSKRHWHQNDPGVVPNLLETGAGSPTGIAVYEGWSLPGVFHNQIVHCDAGPNIVRAYPVEEDRAGYQARIVDVLSGIRDQWFRPSDVCVAPDGSLIVADWYDPGVGGHNMGDIERGRLFRIAPPDTRYRMPTYNLTTPLGGLEALRNPNLAVRYLAWTALHSMQAEAEPALAYMFSRDENPRFRARALWLLGRIGPQARHYVEQAVGDASPDIRITGLRLARQLKQDVIPLVRQLVDDASPAVRRECAIALRHNASPEAADLWAELALRHDGADRWYLEALGIGADRQWDACFDAWLEKAGDGWHSPAGRDIVWRSRSSRTAEYLARILNDPSVSTQELPRYLRAFDFLDGNGKQDVLAELAFAATETDTERENLIVAEAIGRVEGFDIGGKPEYKAALDRVLDAGHGTQQFVKLVDKFALTERYPELVGIAQAHPQEQVGVLAARVLLDKKQSPLLESGLADQSLETALQTATVLGNAADNEAAFLLAPVLSDGARPVELRRAAAVAMAKSRGGAHRLVELTRENRLDEAVKEAVASSLHTARWDDFRDQARELFPLPPAKDSRPLPPLGSLLKMKGDAARGRIVFNAHGTCAKCHVVAGLGKEVGPNLSEIGGKLSREALFQSILYPSAGISHNYETYSLLLGSGNIVNGVVTSRTADSLTIRGADAIDRTYSTAEIDEIKKDDVSLMPADLQKAMTAEDLADVVEYMTTLKKQQASD